MKKLKNGIEIEMVPKKCLSKTRQVCILMYPIKPYSDIEQLQPPPNAEGKNGGLVRQPVLDGAGRSSFEWVFAGNIRTIVRSEPGVGHDDEVPQPGFPESAKRKPDYSLHREWNPKNVEWSLGTNTLSIEGRLRKHKAELGYKEPERRGRKPKHK